LKCIEKELCNQKRWRSWFLLKASESTFSIYTKWVFAKKQRTLKSFLRHSTKLRSFEEIQKKATCAPRAWYFYPKIASENLNRERESVCTGRGAKSEPGVSCPRASLGRKREKGDATR
jgi:hypothetical protein